MSSIRRSDTMPDIKPGAENVMEEVAISTVANKAWDEVVENLIDSVLPPGVVDYQRTLIEIALEAEDGSLVMFAQFLDDRDEDGEEDAPLAVLVLPPVHWVWHLEREINAPTTSAIQ